MYNLHLSPEQLQIRDTVRAFVTEVIKPLALKPERLEARARPLLVAALDQAAAMGLRTLALSEDQGGAGADNLTCCIVTEELAAGDPDVAAVLAQTSTLAQALFGRLMTAEQRARFLPPFLADQRYHLALAEHEADRDAALGINYHRPQASGAPFKTTAVRAGDGWVVNGSKDGVVGASLAALFVVRARVGEGVEPATAKKEIVTLRTCWNWGIAKSRFSPDRRSAPGHRNASRVIDAPCVRRTWRLTTRWCSTRGQRLKKARRLRAGIRPWGRCPRVQPAIRRGCRPTARASRRAVTRSRRTRSWARWAAPSA